MSTKTCNAISALETLLEERPGDHHSGLAESAVKVLLTIAERDDGDLYLSRKTRLALNLFCAKQLERSASDALNTLQQRTAEEFVEWANETLVSLGIGKYADGSRWYYYSLDDEGNVRANDYSESIVCRDWESVTRDDLEDEASAYKS